MSLGLCALACEPSKIWIGRQPPEPAGRAALTGAAASGQAHDMAGTISSDSTRSLMRAGPLPALPSGYINLSIDRSTTGLGALPR
jgi:hypothetical protein